MSPRARNALLLVAGVPGVVALFLPVVFDVVPIEYYWDQLRGGIHWPPRALLQFGGIDWAVALPVAILLLQVRRLMSDREPARGSLLALLMITALLQLAAVAWAFYLLGEITWSPPRGWLDLTPEALYVIVPMWTLSAGNVWLLYRNWRQGVSPSATVETFMMGTYMVAEVFWLVMLLGEPDLAPRLMLWTSVVYAVTIALRLRHSTSRGAVAA